MPLMCTQCVLTYLCKHIQMYAHIPTFFHTQINMITGTMKITCSSAGLLSLMDSQNTLLFTHAAEQHREMEEEGWRDRTEEYVCRAGYRRGRWAKKNQWFYCYVWKREVHGERRDVVRPSGALVLPFHVQSRLPSDFQWEKWTHWCIALISFNI